MNYYNTKSRTRDHRPAPGFNGHLRPRQDGEQRLNNVQSYHALGFNVLALDSHKKPLTHWKSNPDWATTRQTVNDVNHMPWGKARQIAAICGAASGYLICADFDKQPDRAVVDEFLAAFKLLPDYAWCEATPGGGYHVWVKSLDLIPPYDARGGKVDRAGRLAGHIELRFEGVLTTLYFEQVPDCPPATVSGSQLLAAYEQVTKPPEPKSVPDRAPYTAPDLPTDSRELEEVEQRDSCSDRQQSDQAGWQIRLLCLSPGAWLRRERLSV